MNKTQQKLYLWWKAKGHDLGWGSVNGSSFLRCSGSFYDRCLMENNKKKKLIYTTNAAHLIHS